VRLPRRGQDEGFVAAELALGLGLLVVPVALLVLALPGWSERQSAARSIAREVARAAAVSGHCDERAAEALGATMATGLGLGADVRVDLLCPDGTPLPRGGLLAARVIVRMPALTIPGIGAVGAWEWTALHRQPVDAYRSY
jgi:hypothetical protein